MAWIVPIHHCQSEMPQDLTTRPASWPYVCSVTEPTLAQPQIAQLCLAEFHKLVGWVKLVVHYDDVLRRTFELESRPYFRKLDFFE